MEHTKGPWIVTGETGIGSDGTPVFGIGFGISGLLGEAVGEANASLIAAAPELLAALEALIASIDKGDTIVSWSPEYIAEYGILDGQGNLDAGRAAIAKARGL